MQINRNTHSSSTISMQSSVCCLELLQLCDQYFFASSMDGSIKLYDHRGMQRGPVQSYDGNINSHTRIDLGVDPSEKVVMSGGEDCYLRLWDIKSGKLLFKNRFMNSTPSAVCWPRIREKIATVTGATGRSIGGVHGLGHMKESFTWIGCDAIAV